MNQAQTPNQTTQFFGMNDIKAQLRNVRNRELTNPLADKKLLGLYNNINKTLFDLTKEIKKFSIINKPSISRRENVNEQMLKELKDINKIEKQNSKTLKSMSLLGKGFDIAKTILQIIATGALVGWLLTSNNKFVRMVRDGVWGFAKTIGGMLGDWWETGGGKELFKKGKDKIIGWITDDLFPAIGGAFKNIWNLWWDTFKKDHIKGMQLAFAGAGIVLLVTGLWKPILGGILSLITTGFATIGTTLASSIQLLMGKLGTAAGAAGIGKIATGTGVAAAGAFAGYELYQLGKAGIENIKTRQEVGKSIKENQKQNITNLREHFKQQGYAQGDIDILVDPKTTQATMKSIIDLHKKNTESLDKFFGKDNKKVKTTTTVDAVSGADIKSTGKYGLGNVEDIKSMIKRHESLQLKAYPDAGGYSIGYGHYAPGNIQKGKIITQEEADRLFEQDYNKTLSGLKNTFPGFDKLNTNQQAAVTDLTFNMGAGWYTKNSKAYWPSLVNAITSQNSDQISTIIRRSKYYKDVKGQRAEENIALLTGTGISPLIKTMPTDATSVDIPTGKSPQTKFSEMLSTAGDMPANLLAEANKWLVENTPENTQLNLPASSFSLQKSIKPENREAQMRKEAKIYAEELVSAFNMGNRQSKSPTVTVNTGR